MMGRPTGLDIIGVCIGMCDYYNIRDFLFSIGDYNIRDFLFSIGDYNIRDFSIGVIIFYHVLFVFVSSYKLLW